MYKWNKIVSVDDLPETGKRVLGVNKTGRIIIVKKDVVENPSGWKKIRWIYHNHGVVSLNTITHWSELPEPPK